MRPFYLNNKFLLMEPLRYPRVGSQTLTRWAMPTLPYSSVPVVGKEGRNEEA